jgi:hypothetical protein
MLIQINLLNFFYLKKKKLKYFCVKSLSKLITAGFLKIKIVTFVLYFIISAAHKDGQKMVFIIYFMVLGIDQP